MEPGAVVISSPSGSPESKRQKTDELDAPDLALDALLAEQAAATSVMETGAPKWAIALQTTLQNQIQKSHGLMLSFHERLQKIEERDQGRDQEFNRRLQRLEELVGSMGHTPTPGNPSGESALPGSTGNFNQVPPPRDVPRVLPAPAAVPQVQPGDVGLDAGMRTDYNHIIVGGWKDGTKREQILTSAKAVVDLHRLTLDVDDLVVFGKRAAVCHMFLKSLPHQSSVERYLSIKQQLHEKHQIVHQSGNSLMWFTASKPKEVRLKNRKTKVARDMLEDYLSSISANVEVDVEWGKALIWAGDMRVAASSPTTLMPADGHRVISVLTDSNQEDRRFHFNITRLSNLTGAEQSHIERDLYRRQ